MDDVSSQVGRVLFRLVPHLDADVLRNGVLFLEERGQDVMLAKILHNPAVVEVRGPPATDSVPPLRSVKSPIYTSVMYASLLGSTSWKALRTAWQLRRCERGGPFQPRVLVECFATTTESACQGLVRHEQPRRLLD